MIACGSSAWIESMRAAQPSAQGAGDGRDRAAGLPRCGALGHDEQRQVGRARRRPCGTAHRCGRPARSRCRSSRTPTAARSLTVIVTVDGNEVVTFADATSGSASTRRADAVGVQAHERRAVGDLRRCAHLVGGEHVHAAHVDRAHAEHRAERDQPGGDRADEHHRDRAEDELAVRDSAAAVASVGSIGVASTRSWCVMPAPPRPRGARRTLRGCRRTAGRRCRCPS